MIDSNKFNVEEGKSPLKTLRELLGDISQEELARRIGVSVVTVSRWERGVTPATFTIPQMKAFIRELKSVGIDIENFPDDLSPFRFP
jgi:putative transcriptional regulator